MAETRLSDSNANALSGTTDSQSGFVFPTQGTWDYYTAFYKLYYQLLDIVRRAGDLRVYKDGDATFGVRAGEYMDGDTVRTYAGATGQSLTASNTNYIYLDSSGTLQTNTTGFPDPSTTPHLPLAEIVMGASDYDFDDLTDRRGRAFLGLLTGISPATLQDGAPTLTLTGADDGDGTGSVTLQVQDAGGNNLAERCLVRTWIADAEYSEPDAQTDYSVTTGEQHRQIEADADYEVISDATGQVVMNIDAGGAKSVYCMAEIDGRIYSSGEIAITTP